MDALDFTGRDTVADFREGENVPVFHEVGVPAGVSAQENLIDLARVVSGNAVFDLG